MTPWKSWWLDVAEVIDSWRVVPRILLAAYCWWVFHVNDVLVRWYMTLPSDERSLEASGFAAGVVTAITGMAAWVFKIYVAGGRNWGAVEKGEGQ